MSQDNYKETPQTVGEIRSDKTQNAAHWSPRDALINLLRDIDRGEVNPSDLVMVYRERPDKDGGVKTHFQNACCDYHVSLGLLEAGKLKIAEVK